MELSYQDAFKSILIKYNRTYERKEVLNLMVVWSRLLSAI